jgi:hypothetical protein
MSGSRSIPHGYVRLETPGKTWLCVLAPPSRMENRGLAMGVYTAFLDLSLGVTGPALGLIAGLVSAVQVLPALEYSKLAIRWVGMTEPVSHDQPVAYSVHTAYGIQSFALLGTILPGIHRHTNAFIGLLTVLFAISAGWGLWSPSKGRIPCSSGGNWANLTGSG